MVLSGFKPAGTVLESVLELILRAWRECVNILKVEMVFSISIFMHSFFVVRASLSMGRENLAGILTITLNNFLHCNLVSGFYDKLS